MFKSTTFKNTLSSVKSSKKSLQPLKKPIKCPMMCLYTHARGMENEKICIL